MTHIWDVWRKIVTPENCRAAVRKCVAALKREGVWDQVKAWIVAADLYDEYLAAQDFREDDPDFAAGKAALKAQLGWTDEKVEAILAACILEN